MSVAERYAAANLAAVNNQLTPEQSRHIFIAVSSLVMSARDAEQAAFLTMSEIMGNGSARDIDEFNEFMRGHLRKVHEQLRFIGSLINDKKQG